MLKKAKTCDKCRANEGRNECSLGYPVKEWIPMDKCPKPLTIKQLIYSQKYDPKN